MDPQLAQNTIDELVSIRRQGDLYRALDAALRKLVEGLGVDRGLIWQVVGDRLTVTHEHSASNESEQIAGTSLDARQSTEIVLEFLSKFLDCSGDGVILVERDADGENFWAPMFELSLGLSSHLLVQVRADVFSGFLALQSSRTRHWSDEETAVVARVAAVISIIVSDSFLLTKAEMDATSLNTVLKIAALFIDKDRVPLKILPQAVELIASQMPFERSRVYLPSSGKLVSQDNNLSVDLSETSDPVVEVFKACYAKIIEANAPNLQQFGGGAAIILPLLENEDKALGAFALWQPLPDCPDLNLFTRHTAIWLAGQLSKCIQLSGLKSDDLK